MVIEHIIDIVTLILNKNRRGFVKTSQKVSAVRAAMYDFYNAELEVYRKTKVIPESIKKFTKPLPITLTSGVANLPGDFVQEITFEANCENQGVFVTIEEFQDRIFSSILNPDQENPIAKIQNGTIVAAPEELLSLTLIYFRIPTDFVYGTTLAGDSRSETFDVTTSTDIEFGYAYSFEIIRRALLYLGIAFQNEEALKLAISGNDNTK